MKKIRDPELVRLIEQYHGTMAESDRLGVAAHEAKVRFQEASEALASHLATHEERDDDGGLIDHRSFLFRGHFYCLHDRSNRITDLPRYFVDHVKPYLLVR